jgi:hypothetical protein
MTPKAIIATVVSILAIAASLCGAVYFLEDRYVDEKEAVMTIHQQQQITDLQLLELWREQKRNLEERWISEPGNIMLKERLERTKENIKRIEERLFNQ